MLTRGKNLIRPKRGFTLVELMISLAIIGILASVALPQFKRYKLKTLDSERYAHLKQIYAGASMYFQIDVLDDASSTSAHYTHCVPSSSVAHTVSAGGGDGAAQAQSAMVPQVWLAKVFGYGLLPMYGDTSRDPIWQALGFSMDAPSYFGYFAHGAGGWGQAGQNCGAPANSEGTAVFQFGARSDIDQDGTWGWLYIFAASRNGALYRSQVNDAENH